MGLLQRLGLRPFKPTSLDQILDPGPDGLKGLSPHDLAKYKAGWAPGTANWILADSELRRRERWSGPAKLALLISGVALLLSFVALLNGYGDEQDAGNYARKRRIVDLELKTDVLTERIDGLEKPTRVVPARTRPYTAQDAVRDAIEAERQGRP